MPWKTSGQFTASPINAVSRKAYRGINVLILRATYKQWQELGAQVRKGEKPANLAERIDQAEAFFRALEVNIQHGGNQVFYRPSTGTVPMPAFERFKNPLAYYSVLSHETTHWTGCEKRLNRDMKHRLRSEAYAIEELVAELGLSAPLA